MPVYGRNDTVPDDVPELDFDLSTISESEPKTNFDDSPETDDQDDQDDQDDGNNEDNEDNEDNDNNDNDQDESHDQDDDFEPEYDGYDSGYEAEAEFESDDEEYDDDSSQEDQDSESDGNHFSAINRLIEQLDLLRLKVEMYAARRAARTNPVNSLSRHSNVRPAYEGFVIDVSHLDIHNNAPQSAAAAAAATVVVLVSPLAGQHNEPARCTISFRWWLTGCEHAEYSVPIVLYVLVCDYFTVLAAGVLCATLWTLARPLLCSPRGIIIIVRPPLSGVSFVWLKHAPPMVTAASVALDAIAADESGRVLRRRGCRAWTALPVFGLRREWAGARRQFVVVSFTSFAVLSLVHVAICSFGITAAVEGSEIGGG